MRVAIFSDVHGNLSALEIVLADIERQAPDLIVFAGDLCLFGPRPAECLRLVLERQLPSVIGNTDAWLADTSQPPARHPEAIEWTRDQLSPDELARLGRLPFALRVSPTARAGDDLLIRRRSRSSAGARCARATPSWSRCSAGWRRPWWPTAISISPTCGRGAS